MKNINDNTDYKALYNATMKGYHKLFKESESEKNKNTILQIKLNELKQEIITHKKKIAKLEKLNDKFFEMHRVDSEEMHIDKY
jgi:hypothetical protein